MSDRQSSRFPFQDSSVERIFAAYEEPVRAALLDLRTLVLETAGELSANTPKMGPIVETLKWGQPSYLPKKPKIGSTVRIDAISGGDHDLGMYFHCQTTLVAGFREQYPDQFTFSGNRALLFSNDRRWPDAALRHCVAQALTYHLKTQVS